MKVQLKSPVFEISKEEYDRLMLGGCVNGACEVCPFYHEPYCGRSAFIQAGYILTEVEEWKSSEG